MHLEISVSKILTQGRQNYQIFIEMTSNMIYILALGVGFKCPRKIHLNTQWGGKGTDYAHRISDLPPALVCLIALET